MENPERVGQPFQAAGEGRFPAPRAKTNDALRDWKVSPPADKNVCPTLTNSALLSGFHSRDHLPHLKREGGSYFITFRLAGTLPADVLIQFKQEREQILAHALATKRPLTWFEQEKLFAWYSERVDNYLDRGQGDCWLREPEIAQIVAAALSFHNGVRFDLGSWVIMPNHVHVVVRPRSGWTLSRVLQSWKGYTSRKANLTLLRTGKVFWQSESFDHLIRDDADFHRCCHYTVANPVKAGFCTRPEDWKWSSLYVP